MEYTTENEVVGPDRSGDLDQFSWLVGEVELDEENSGLDTEQSIQKELRSDVDGFICFTFLSTGDSSYEAKCYRPYRQSEIVRRRSARAYQKTDYERAVTSKVESIRGTASLEERRRLAIDWAKTLIDWGWEPDEGTLKRYMHVMMQGRGERQ